MKNEPKTPINFESTSALAGVFFLLCYYAVTNHTKLHALEFFSRRSSGIICKLCKKKFSEVMDVGWNKRMLNIWRKNVMLSYNDYTEACLQMLESSLAARMISSSSTNIVASILLFGCT